MRGSSDLLVSMYASRIKAIRLVVFLIYAVVSSSVVAGQTNDDEPYAAWYDISQLSEEQANVVAGYREFRVPRMKEVGIPRFPTSELFSAHPDDASSLGLDPDLRATNLQPLLLVSPIPVEQVADWYRSHLLRYTHFVTSEGIFFFDASIDAFDPTRDSILRLCYPHVVVNTIGASLKPLLPGHRTMIEVVYEPIRLGGLSKKAPQNDIPECQNRRRTNGKDQ